MKERVERRRFYLSESSMDYLDALAFQQGTTPSRLLDAILQELYKKAH